ncbi:hypothetical protein ACOSQ3_029312 [Xanthoceras sorbifolium]
MIETGLRNLIIRELKSSRVGNYTAYFWQFLALTITIFTIGQQLASQDVQSLQVQFKLRIKKKTRKGHSKMLSLLKNALIYMQQVKRFEFSMLD